MQEGADSSRFGVLEAAVELLHESGRGGIVRVQGESMRPTLRPGMLLSVEFSPSPLGRGDLLLFRQVDSLLVHRLLGPARPRDGRRPWRTRGDASMVLDPPVDPDNVLGRVVALYDDDEWRTLRSARARGYAWCLAWHDLFWAALAVAARYGDRMLRRSEQPGALYRIVTWADRWLSRQVHRVLFRKLHGVVRVVEQPEN